MTDGGDAAAARLLGAARTIAVVGMSTTPGKAAHAVPGALVRAGWHVIPVNPNAIEVLGLRSRRSLDEVDEPVDIVDVFRPAAETAAVTRQAVAIGAGAVWLQLGISSVEARDVATAAGITYVEDTCIDIVRRQFGVTPPAAPPAS